MKELKQKLLSAIPELIIATLIIVIYVTAGIITSLCISQSLLQDIIVAISLCAGFYTLALIAKNQTGENIE